ncbi:DHA2 family efflux MFS transporter permease subunit [Gordonia humi]|uniref:EmrB/QacA subfamily drug resistance transporter n=1 Tax=Gordonia humi TaxID=686429 RepID=A0A840EZA4_9ACTN|nr:EmrB/QacA subfamily drug resistance transporter [Gordonia humi]
MERKWWTLVIVCIGTFMLLLDVTIVTVALPDIERDLHASFTDLQWVTDAYALTLASLLLTAGSLADRFGRRLVFGVGLAIFTAGSALCGAAVSPEMLIGSRAAQGIGGAMLFATSLAILAANFHGRDRGIAFGVWGAVTGIATALGPILGGTLTTGISWRGIFYVNLPFGVLALVLTYFLMSESKAPHARRIDWAGMITFTVGLFLLIFGFTEAGEKSWTDSTAITCFIAAAVLLIAFGIIEWKIREPMFDLDLFRVPTFVGGSIAAFCMNGSAFAMMMYLVLYLQNQLGLSAFQAGLRLLVFSGATMVVATIAGRLTEKLPTRWMIGPGLVLVGVGLFLMAGIDADSSWTHLIAGFIVAGIGGGLVNPPLASTAVGVVPVARSGMASGVNNTFRQVGIAVGIAVYGTLFSSAIVRGLQSRLSDDATTAINPNDIASAVSAGQQSAVIDHAPAPFQSELAGAVGSSFASALNELLWVSGGLAVVGGVLALVLIRSKDFVAAH